MKIRTINMKLLVNFCLVAILCICTSCANNEDEGKNTLVVGILGPDFPTIEVLEDDPMQMDSDYATVLVRSLLFEPLIKKWRVDSRFEKRLIERPNDHSLEYTGFTNESQLCGGQWYDWFGCAEDNLHGDYTNWLVNKPKLFTDYTTNATTMMTYSFPLDNKDIYIRDSQGAYKRYPLKDQNSISNSLNAVILSVKKMLKRLNLNSNDVDISFSNDVANKQIALVIRCPRGSQEQIIMALSSSIRLFTVPEGAETGYRGTGPFFVNKDASRDDRLVLDRFPGDKNPRIAAFKKNGRDVDRIVFSHKAETSIVKESYFEADIFLTTDAAIDKEVDKDKYAKASIPSGDHYYIWINEDRIRDANKRRWIYHHIFLELRDAVLKDEKLGSSDNLKNDYWFPSVWEKSSAILKIDRDNARRVQEAETSSPGASGGNAAQSPEVIGRSEFIGKYSFSTIPNGQMTKPSLSELKIALPTGFRKPMPEQDQSSPLYEALEKIVKKKIGTAKIDVGLETQNIAVAKNYDVVLLRQQYHQGLGAPSIILENILDDEKSVFNCNNCASSSHWTGALASTINRHNQTLSLRLLMDEITGSSIVLSDIKKVQKILYDAATLFPLYTSPIYVYFNPSKVYRPALNAEEGFARLNCWYPLTKPSASKTIDTDTTQDTATNTEARNE